MIFSQMQHGLLPIMYLSPTYSPTYLLNQLLTYLLPTHLLFTYMLTYIFSPSYNLHIYYPPTYMIPT
jgi:hypothetical protein